MKIAVISSTVFSVPLSGYGGLEAIAYETAKGLANKGHEATIFAPEGSATEWTNKTDTPSLFTIGPPNHWDERKAYSSYWQELPNYDVVIDHTWQKWSYILKQEGRLKAPVLGVMHAPVDTMYRKIPPVDKPCIVCISDDQKSHFEALFSRPARRAYNGIDLNHYKPLDLKRSDRFLFLARFSSIKGADLAIEACKKAGVGLDLIGDTSITNEPDYLKKCQSMCDGKQIKMVGACSRGGSVWWYSQAHCMVHPNQRFREPFGLAPVEAMACGCPVIAWNYGAMRETVDPGITGILCDSFDFLVTNITTMSKVLKDSDRPRCRKWASQFSIENMVNRYEELCTEAVETGGW